MTDFARAVAPLIERLDALFDRLEAILPPPLPPPDWSATAFRWRTRGGRGWLEAVKLPHRIRFEDLQAVDEQKQRIAQNTRQFLARRSANNVLLTGARGTGKSSLVKAVFNQFSARGLRLIEVDKDDLVHLPEIVDLIVGRRERFIIFCDDLSFESGEPGFKAMKSILDGSISGMPDNLLVYATSNRRHLMPEKMSENLETLSTADGDIHPGETTEEKVSLSERFGLWLSFYPFSQDHYLEICGHWLAEFGASPQQIAAARGEALQWSLMRGSRSGRVAWQFARDHAGRHAKKPGPRSTAGIAPAGSGGAT
ncbi:MAG: ATP-binding protein [Sulfuritalea sp.]|nr:ATP-binding protein [Sulfuritalea sp.]MBK8118062.1 ATP-binding protein [Sulfuritalea sp.]